MELQREDRVIIVMDSKEAGAILAWMDHLESREVQANTEIQEFYRMLCEELK